MKPKTYLITVLLILMSGQALAQVDSPIQADKRPFGLEIKNTVKQAGSDAASLKFYQQILPAAMNVLKENGAATTREQFKTVSIDPAAIVLKEAVNPRVYLVLAASNYKSTLGFNTSGGALEAGAPALIFPLSVATVSSYVKDLSKLPVRTQRAPLAPGDFVELGRQRAKTTLNFFLGANAYHKESLKDVWSTRDDLNSDNIQHILVFALPDTPYLLVCFEDLKGGGDYDYDDLIVAVDVGTANVRHLARLSPDLVVTPANRRK